MLVQTPGRIRSVDHLPTTSEQHDDVRVEGLQPLRPGALPRLARHGHGTLEPVARPAKRDQVRMEHPSA